MEKNIQKLPVVSLRDVVVFPHITLPLYVGREKSLKAIEASLQSNNQIVLVTQKNPQNSDPAPDELFSIATRASIKQYSKLSDGNVKLLIEGLDRVEIKSFVQTEPHLEAIFEFVPIERTTPEVEQKWMSTLITHLESYFNAISRPFEEIANGLAKISDPHQLIHAIAAQIPLKLRDRQRLLEIRDPIERIEFLCTLVLSELELTKLDRKIKDQVRERIEKSQKEYFLNEQMSAIQKELGTDGDFREEILNLEKRLTEKKLPENVRERATKELKRLKLSNGHAAEASVIRTYIELILDLPWLESSLDSTDLSSAEKILNEDHFGLKNVKERILEFLAVRSKTDLHQSPIVCFVGPPGVGKTSLAKSIARSLNRKFERISVGGLRDESELRGHRRTYVGAMPGKIINAIKKSGTNNPVILLDEVDKMGMDFRGDPASALLEILDPEQNKTFTDHYLDMEFDLSKVLFITTANILDPISAPLKDRMEIIQLSGYTEDEKAHIAHDYILPKELKHHGLAANFLKLDRPTLAHIIQNYTREAGVRNLQKEIAKLCRKVVRKFVQEGPTDPRQLDIKAIEILLGPPRFKVSSLGALPEVGVVTGLAWTAQGGEVLVIEANILPGKGKMQITGQLGSVMQESAKAALSYVRSKAYLYGFSDDYFAFKDIHIHVPEGATPKDGPSAGVTIATALLSALTKTPISKEYGMTGEITLRGRVLPIGGLKEKLLAARRNGVKTIFYPFENERDRTELDAGVTEGLKLIPVYHMDEIFDKLFEKTKTKIERSDLYIDQKPLGSTLGPSGPLL